MFSHSTGWLADHACSAREEELKSDVLTALLCVQTPVGIVDVPSVRYIYIDHWIVGTGDLVDHSQSLELSMSSGVARECFIVGHVTAGAYVVQGGSGGMHPQENLNFRPSKAVFGAF